MREGSVKVQKKNLKLHQVFTAHFVDLDEINKKSMRSLLVHSFGLQRVSKGQNVLKLPLETQEEPVSDI